MIYIRLIYLFPILNNCFLLQKKTRIRIWIYEDPTIQMEGIIIGFDEYMNIVLDDAIEIQQRRLARPAHSAQSALLPLKLHLPAQQLQLPQSNLPLLS